MSTNKPTSQSVSNPPATASAEKPPAQINVAFFATATVAAIGSLALGMKGSSFYAGMSLVPFSFGPLVITVILSFALRSRVAQALLSFSSVLYAVWFGYVYAQAFYLNPDPQSPIAFLFIGIYAIPVLAVFWIAACGAQWQHAWKLKNNQTEGEIKAIERQRDTV